MPDKDKPQSVPPEIAKPEVTKPEVTKPEVTMSISGQLDLIEEIIRSFPECGRILDVGTGSGLAARRFAESGWDVTATGFNMEAYLKDSLLPEAINVLPDVDICDAHQLLASY